MENQTVSLFKGYSDTCPVETPLQAIVTLLRDNHSVAEHTEKHRYYLKHGQNTAAAREKASCPCFAVAVRFKGGKQKANISGSGIQLLVRYTGLTDNREKNLRLHAHAFAAINEHYARLTGLECDPKCKNATRLSGLAHDEQLFFNADTEAFSLPAEAVATLRKPARNAKGQNLLSPELRRYFYLKSNSHRITKDDLLTLTEFALVCLEELDEMEASEVNQIKALTTMKHINERAAYAHYKEHRQHIASFCGTSNNIHFLVDRTGNRRWLPFEVENIDSPYDFPVDYAGVYP